MKIILDEDELKDLSSKILGALVGNGILSTNMNHFHSEDWESIIEEKLEKYFNRYFEGE